MLVASRKKGSPSVINGAKANQRLNLKEKHSESILSEYYILRYITFTLKFIFEFIFTLLFYSIITIPV